MRITVGTMDKLAPKAVYFFCIPFGKYHYFLIINKWLVNQEWLDLMISNLDKSRGFSTNIQKYETV